ncbi:MAG TPA: hypothetical protein DD424_09100 [Porphyromonadaceae bacterium]|nr:hypothetical protein [Porphyromonadaceae bacterium]
MARYGYILHSADDATIRNIDELGCCRIFRECRYDTMTRPERRTLLRQIENNDEIIVPGLCHIVNGCTGLAVFLEYCEFRNIRLISLEDRIDTAGILYDGESDRNIVSAFKTLTSDVAAIKKGNGEMPLQVSASVKTAARERKTKRDSRVISMYLAGLNTGDILRHNNISKTTLFRLLRKHGIPTDRIGKKRPICE